MTPQYSYHYVRGKWVIYKDNTPTDEWFTYAMREAARKRVYELNGWKYKEKKEK